MAKKQTKRVATHNERSTTEPERNVTADQTASRRSSGDEGASKQKVKEPKEEYEILEAGTIIGDKKYNIGDTVDLTASECETYRAAGVPLAGPKE